MLNAQRPLGRTIGTAACAGQIELGHLRDLIVGLSLRLEDLAPVRGTFESYTQAHNNTEKLHGAMHVNQFGQC